MEFSRKGMFFLSVSIILLVLLFYFESFRYQSCDIQIFESAGNYKTIIEFPVHEKISSIKGIEIQYIAGGYSGSSEEIDESYKESIEDVKQSWKIEDNNCILTLQKCFYFRGGGEAPSKMRLKVLVNGELLRLSSENEKVKGIFNH